MFFCKVCAMMINEKNYKFNGSGLPQENSIEEIQYCPFCGAGREYLTSDKNKIFNVDVEDLLVSDKIILDHAAKLEVFNGDFYKQMAQRTEKLQIKEMFESLSRIEFIHAKVHLRLSGKSEMPILKKMAYDRLKNVDDFINEANSREKHAVKFYTKSMEETSNPIVKEVFKALMKIEGDHIDMTE